MHRPLGARLAISRPHCTIRNSRLEALQFCFPMRQSFRSTVSLYLFGAFYSIFVHILPWEYHAVDKEDKVLRHREVPNLDTASVSRSICMFPPLHNRPIFCFDMDRSRNNPASHFSSSPSS